MMVFSPPEDLMRDPTCVDVWCSFEGGHRWTTRLWFSRMVEFRQWTVAVWCDGQHAKLTERFATYEEATAFFPKAVFAAALMYD